MVISDFRTSVLKSEITSIFLKKFRKNTKKYVDFCFGIHYTIITWSKMVAKWSKME